MCNIILFPDIRAGYGEQLNAFEDALLEHESLSREEIEEILDQAEEEYDEDKKASNG